MTQHGGRIEQRRLTASTALVGYSDWPGLQQALRLERRVLDKRTGALLRQEVAYAVTSCAPARAPPRSCWRSGGGAGRSESVQAQMTKARLLAARAGRDDIANRDLVIGHHHAIDEQFDQLSLLREGCLG